jgi:ribosomal protein L37E
MGLIAALVSDETVVAECRRCGTSVDSGTASCSACGSDDITEYAIS